MFDAGQHGRIADLVAIEVQDRQHGSIENWVDNLLDCHAVARGPVSAFTIADDAGDDQSGLSNTAPKAWLSGIPQLTTFVNRPRRSGRNMAGNPAGNENCLNSASFRLRPG